MNKGDIIPERPELPEELKDTEAHVIMPNMGLIPSQLARVPDLDTGVRRTRRFGAWLGLNILPHIHEQMRSPDAPLLLPEPPPVLLVADDLDTLRKRIMFEVDVMLDTTQDYLDGKIVLNDDGLPILADRGDTDGSDTAKSATVDAGS